MTSSAVRPLRRVVGALALVVLVSTSLLWVSAQSPAGDVAIDPDDIGGVVRGPSGPEAGVWVIAETRDLGVRYIKSVVTDDQGRFVIPDLPDATYEVWARGYGLVDSAKSHVEPGAQVEYGGRSLRPPAREIVPHPLDSYRLADRLRQHQRIRAHIVEPRTAVRT